MKPRDAEEYTQSLGLIVAGSWRQIALAKRMGVPKALGLSVEQWVKDKLGGYVKMDALERKEAALELKANGHSTREIGEVLGVDHATAARDVANATARSDKHQKNEEEPVAFATEPAPVDAMAALASVEGMPSARAKFSGEVEWYTPREYVDLAREVLGEIDLDPASSAVAQETVRAANYFTKADDGLSKEWRGRVFLNPPYAQPHIANFMQKMVDEHASGRVAGAVMLTNSNTDTGWFALGAKHASAICFTTGRIKFIDPHGERNAPLQGQAFFYFGPCSSKPCSKQSGSW